MRRRAIVVTALLLGLLTPAVPASAADRVTLSGRVLDENGRGVASATVRFTAIVTDPPPERHWVSDLVHGLFDALGCAFSFGFSCVSSTEPRVFPVAVTARTDASGRYVHRFDAGLLLDEQTFDDVEVTRPALIRGTLPPKTTTSVRYRGGSTLPTFRLWLRGASAGKVSTTHRRVRAKVPAVLGTPVAPVKVFLVQGSGIAWSYGGVVGGVRTVDTRVVETGTTGTQTAVTTKVGSRYVTYRSGVRPVTKSVRPLSRGKRCYEYYVVAPEELPRCPLTDGRLSSAGVVGAQRRRQVVIDLGELSVPEAYVVRGCDVNAVAASVEGTVYLAVRVKETESHVYVGKPGLPARYVRLDVGTCWPREISVHGEPYAIL